MSSVPFVVRLCSVTSRGAVTEAAVYDGVAGAAGAPNVAPQRLPFLHMSAPFQPDSVDPLQPPGPVLSTHGTGWKDVPGVSVPLRIIWEHPSTKD